MFDQKIYLRAMFIKYIMLLFKFRLFFHKFFNRLYYVYTFHIYRPTFIRCHNFDSCRSRSAHPISLLDAFICSKPTERFLDTYAKRIMRLAKHFTASRTAHTNSYFSINIFPKKNLSLRVVLLHVRRPRASCVEMTWLWRIYKQRIYYIYIYLRRRERRSFRLFGCGECLENIHLFHTK